MKGRERKVREKGGHKLKKCSEDAAVFLFCCCDSNHEWEVALTQSDIKVTLTLYWFCPELISIQLLLFNLEALGFSLFLTWDSSSASERGYLGHNEMCCAFVYQKEIRGFSVPVRFRGRCWYLLSFGLLVFCFGVMGLGFFHWVIWFYFFSYSTRYFLWEAWSA